MSNPTPIGSPVEAVCRHCGRLVRRRLTGRWHRPLADADLMINTKGEKMPGWCVTRGGPYSTAREWSNHEPIVLEREALEEWLAS